LVGIISLHIQDLLMLEREIENQKGQTQSKSRACK
jgi:hypothetical protein